jgi:hypothetical protein
LANADAFEFDGGPTLYDLGDALEGGVELRNQQHAVLGGEFSGVAVLAVGGFLGDLLGEELLGLLGEEGEGAVGVKVDQALQGEGRGATGLEVEQAAKLGG